MKIGIACLIPFALATGSTTTGAAPAVYRGANLSGAEFNGRRLPGRIGKDYTYPAPALVARLRAGGMTTFRLPLRWERLQPALNGPLAIGELERIDAFVRQVAEGGGYVILDPHNYARYGGKAIGTPEAPSAAFADFWRRVAKHYGRNPAVIFGLMNEPHDIPGDVWFGAAQAAIDAIRAGGAPNLVLVPGTRWTGAHSWFAGTPSNAALFSTLRDPARNMAVEVHQYFDADGSGRGTSCASREAGVKALAPMTAWLRRNGHRAMLAEFGGSAEPTCLAALDATLTHIDRNGDAWAGWTYWAAGSWLGRYPYAIDMTGPGEPAQAAILRRHLPETGRARR